MPYDDTYADDQHRNREAALERRRQMKENVKKKGLDPLGKIVARGFEIGSRPSSFGSKKRERVKA